MTYTRLTLVSLFLSGTLFFTGCGEAPNLDDISASDGDFIYNGRNFGSNRNINYKIGVKDGCATSNGEYIKNHALFNGNGSYHNGWEHGRIHCNPADKAKYYNLIRK